MPEVLGNSLTNPTSTLASGISSGDTSLTVASGHGARFPATGTFRVVIGTEIILVGARATDVLSSLTRGAESTAAAAHSTGDPVDVVLTKGAIDAYAAPLVHVHAAADVSTGTLAAARLGTGTPDATKFLQGDGAWTLTVDEIPRQLVPVAWHGAVNLTTVTVLVTNVSYFLYVGRAGNVLSTMSVIARVTAAAATITWAEVGIFKGVPVAGGAATGLTRLGFTNVAATFNTTGIKTTAVALSGHAANDDLWLAFGSQATTPYQLRAGLADDIQGGGFQSTATRISTMGATTGTLVAATLAVPMARGHFV